MTKIIERALKGNKWVLVDEVASNERIFKNVLCMDRRSNGHRLVEFKKGLIENETVIAASVSLETKNTCSSLVWGVESAIPDKDNINH